jgi:hypothetical protein
MGITSKSQVGHSVYFPKCGLYPIASGGTMCLNELMPQSRIGDKVSCPGGAFLITGDALCTDTMIPTCGIGDLAFGPKCKIGIVCRGSSIRRG